MTWNPVITNLMTGLEAFTGLHAATVRRFGAATVDLSFPNPRFLADPRPYPLLAEIASQAGPVDLRYSPFGGFTPVRRRLATALARQHDLPYTWGSITMTPGAAPALNVVLHTFFTPGDRIMLARPCWMDYPLHLARLGLDHALLPAAPGRLPDPETIARAWTTDTRGFIISQPASPTGIVHTLPELRQLADLLHDLGRTGSQPPILIADEAHHGQVWADVTCPSPAEIYPETITLRSVSKTWDMQGQRTGYIAVSPRFTGAASASRLLEQAMRMTGHYAPTSLMQHLAARLADETPDTTALAALQRTARRELARLGVDVVPAHATRFLYARSPTPDLVGALADHGVLAMPSTLFHEPGWFRLSLNQPEPDLSRALTIIGKTIHDA